KGMEHRGAEIAIDTPTQCPQQSRSVFVPGLNECPVSAQCGDLGGGHPRDEQQQAERAAFDKEEDVVVMQWGLDGSAEPASADGENGGWAGECASEERGT